MALSKGDNVVDVAVVKSWTSIVQPSNVQKDITSQRLSCRSKRLVQFR